MECPGGGAGGAVLSGGNVPAFLTKLWTLVEDPDTDPLICWSPSGTSFHVFDQGRFSKEVLPKFFKHNNMASFIRQLNMYGFRKVVHIEQGGLVKPERDDTEFQHPFFIRGQEHLLENIKRKVTNVSSVRQEEVKMSTDEVNKILNDVQLMKGKQETIDSRIIAMRHENEALWREVASLRQKHVQQQKVVNKLIQFLVSLVQSNRVLGVKRKIPLMLNDSSSTHSVPKYSRPFSLEHMQAAASLFSADSPVNSGPIISDITEVATPTAEDVVSDWTDAGESQSVNVKQEPSSPDVEVCSSLEGGALPVDTPLSPTTFINSILQDSETQLTPNTSTTNPTTASPIVLVSPASTGPLPPTPASQSPASVPIPDTAPSPSKTQQKCQTIACIDRSELSDHVDSIDNSLENLQSILNTQTFTFDTSPLMEFFSSSCPSGDFDLDSLDTLLSEEVPKGSDESTANHTGNNALTQVTQETLTQETGNTDTGNTGNTDTGNTDTGNTGNTDTGNTDSGNTGNTDSGNTGNTDSGNTGNTETGNRKQETLTQETGNTDTGNTGNTDTGNTGNSDSGNTGNTDSGNRKH
ncbi:heat shock factor protein 1 isoform X3 [Dicentrarchus labrax]|uniref:heat shock factor protein 1 isoform X3 n=1 Tax=Dicentrarchus labrax TaxID=13489 RepID=UPI0021F66441|nr:heat shock factor protein 1 isoform X3 [Dicentrarchus labrax]